MLLKVISLLFFVDWQADQTKVALKSTTSSASATSSTLSTSGISLRANVSLAGNDSSTIHDRNDTGLLENGENKVSFIGM